MAGVEVELDAKGPEEKITAAKAAFGRHYEAAFGVGEGAKLEAERKKVPDSGTYFKTFQDSFDKDFKAVPKSAEMEEEEKLKLQLDYWTRLGSLAQSEAAKFYSGKEEAAAAEVLKELFAPLVEKAKTQEEEQKKKLQEEEAKKAKQDQEAKEKEVKEAENRQHEERQRAKAEGGSAYPKPIYAAILEEAKALNPLFLAALNKPEAGKFDGEVVIYNFVKRFDIAYQGNPARPGQQDPTLRFPADFKDTPENRAGLELAYLQKLTAEIKADEEAFYPGKSAAVCRRVMERLTVVDVQAALEGVKKAGELKAGGLGLGAVGSSGGGGAGASAKVEPKSEGVVGGLSSSSSSSFPKGKDKGKDKEEKGLKKEDDAKPDEEEEKKADAAEPRDPRTYVLPDVDVVDAQKPKLLILKQAPKVVARAEDKSVRPAVAEGSVLPKVGSADAPLVAEVKVQPAKRSFVGVDFDSAVKEAENAVLEHLGLLPKEKPEAALPVASSSALDVLSSSASKKKEAKEEVGGPVSKVLSDTLREALDGYLDAEAKKEGPLKVALEADQKDQGTRGAAFRAAFYTRVLSLPRDTFVGLFDKEERQVDAALAGGVAAAVVEVKTTAPAAPAPAPAPALAAPAAAAAAAEAASEPEAKKVPVQAIIIRKDAISTLEAHYQAAMRHWVEGYEALVKQAQTVDLMTPPKQKAVAGKRSPLAQRVLADFNDKLGLNFGDLVEPKAKAGSKDTVEVLSDENVLQLAKSYNAVVRDLDYRSRAFDVYGALLRHDKTLDPAAKELGQDEASYFEVFGLDNVEVVKDILFRHAQFLLEQQRRSWYRRLVNSAWPLATVLFLTSLAVGAVIFNTGFSAAGFASFAGPMGLLAILGPFASLAFAGIMFVAFLIVVAFLSVTVNKPGADPKVVASIHALLGALREAQAQKGEAPLTADEVANIIAQYEAELGKLPSTRWKGLASIFQPSKPAVVMGTVGGLAVAVLIVAGIPVLGFIPGVTWTSLAVLAAMPAYQAVFMLLATMLIFGLVAAFVTNLIGYLASLAFGDEPALPATPRPEAVVQAKGKEKEGDEFAPEVEFHHEVGDGLSKEKKKEDETAPLLGKKGDDVSGIGSTVHDSEGPLAEAGGVSGEEKQARVGGLGPKQAAQPKKSARQGKGGPKSKQALASITSEEERLIQQWSGKPKPGLLRPIDRLDWSKAQKAASRKAALGLISPSSGDPLSAASVELPAAGLLPAGGVGAAKGPEGGQVAAAGVGMGLVRE